MSNYLRKATRVSFHPTTPHIITDLSIVRPRCRQLSLPTRNSISALLQKDFYSLRIISTTYIDTFAPNLLALRNKGPCHVRAALQMPRKAHKSLLQRCATRSPCLSPQADPSHLRRNGQGQRPTPRSWLLRKEREKSKHAEGRVLLARHPGQPLFRLEASCCKLRRRANFCQQLVR